MSEFMQLVFCIALLALSVFLGSMAAYVLTLSSLAAGLPTNRKKAVEAVEEKEKRERMEQAKSKVGKII